MANKYLHIVCLDVPYPADYGGVFDLFYKIKSLHEQGIQIHLHCFEYGRGSQSELNKYCNTVTYYKRKKIYNSVLTGIPYIVSSRANRLLLNNISNDTYPVLLEGIHCTYFLYNNDLKNKKVLVRLHNVEYVYYKELAQSANNILKKIYYKAESFLLKMYEKKIASKALLLAVSEKDKEIYVKKFSAAGIEYLPVFLPYKNVLSKEGMGNFCLYHGNLSVTENEKAALWLVSEVFNHIDIPFIIAGKNPSKHLIQLAEKNENICIIKDPSENEMNDLIEKAHIHVLPSFNTTGVKIKLLNALFRGKFVITNNISVEETNLAKLCKIAEHPDAYKCLVRELFNKLFTQEDIEERKEILEADYDNDKNALKLIRLIW